MVNGAGKKCFLLILVLFGHFIIVETDSKCFVHTKYVKHFHSVEFT